MNVAAADALAANVLPIVSQIQAAGAVTTRVRGGAECAGHSHRAMVGAWHDSTVRPCGRVPRSDTTKRVRSPEGVGQMQVGFVVRVAVQLRHWRRACRSAHPGVRWPELLAAMHDRQRARSDQDGNGRLSIG
jgi:hypothetical protein